MQLKASARSRDLNRVLWRHQYKEIHNNIQIKSNSEKERMRAKNMPGALPMLPGNVYADPTVTRYHKTQLLGVKDGAICGKWTLVK